MRTTLQFGLLIICGSGLMFILGQLNSCTNSTPFRTGSASDSIPQTYAYAELLRDNWIAPDTSSLTENETDSLIRYGRELIMHTGKYFGPAGIISKSANGMNCQNCHLEAGTKLWANSFSAVFSNYPKQRARSGSLENLVMRINDCMERSMNGNTFDSLGREMQAMIAYINWVGKDVPKDSTPEGASVVQLKFLDRAADPGKGKLVFETHCVTCHGKNGAGQLDPEGGIIYPPLWGRLSYNTAAGMYRLSRLAGFVKSNMPYLKSSFDNPVLTDEESWDVAAFINSQPRVKKMFDKDWPDVAKKPIDHPFGPYADSFSEEQHKYGPFKEIKEFYTKVEKPDNISHK